MNEIIEVLYDSKRKHDKKTEKIKKILYDLNKKRNITD